MSFKLLTILTLTAAIASPATAQERAGRRRVEANSTDNQEQRARIGEGTPRDRAVPRAEPPRSVQSDRRAPGRDGRYDDHRSGYGRPVPRRYYPPRVIRPTVVRVIPYRPYVYRPSYRAGVVYGSGGYYPYGYTPRGYYDPVPGRPYGGLRITDAPRYARVFADGYFVGLVNDFDGVFQHLNLEAGPHRIEIEDDGYGAIAFDVYIRPGQTITYRAGY